MSFFLLGLSFGIGPCLASCGPLLISYAGATQKNILQSIFAYLFFSFSRILSYVVLGLLIFFTGEALVQHKLFFLAKYIYIFSGFFIAALGLLLAMGRYQENKLCRRLQEVFLKKDRKTIFLLGLVVGILPCAPLLTVVSYIGLIAQNWLDNLLGSIFFGLGTVISPLFLLMIFSGVIPHLLKSHPQVYRCFNSVCGLVMVFLGIQLIRRAF